MTWEQIRLFRIESLCKAAGLSRRPVRGKGVCSDFRWRRAKAWKRCQLEACFWIDSNQSLQPNWSRRSVLNFKLSVLTFSWAARISSSIFIEQKLCEVKYFNSNISTTIYVECDKMYRSKFAFKNSGIQCLVFNLCNLRRTILHTKKRLQIAKHFKYYTVFFCRLTRTHGLA